MEIHATLRKPGQPSLRDRLAGAVTLDEEQKQRVEDARLAGVREAQAELAPYVAEAKSLIREVDALAQEYRPVLETLAGLSGWKLWLRHPATERVARWAETAINDTLRVVSNFERHMQSEVIERTKNLSHDPKALDRGAVATIRQYVEMNRDAPAQIRKNVEEIANWMDELERLVREGNVMPPKNAISRLDVASEPRLGNAPGTTHAVTE